MDFYNDTSARPLGKGKLAPAGSVTDADLSRMLAGYKRSTASRYRAVKPDEVTRAILPGALLVSPKIDGELWYLVVEGGACALVAPNGKVISGDLPVLAEVTRLVAARTGQSGRTVIAGELYALRKGGRSRVGDLARAMGGGADAAVQLMGFYAFDLLVEDGEDRYAMPYEERLEVLQRVTEGGKRIAAVRTEKVAGSGEIGRLFAEWVEGGRAEGLVVRTLDNRIYKVKPIFTLDAAVIGYTVRADAPDTVRSLLLAVMRADGQFQIVGSVGNLGTEEFRKSLLPGLEAAVTESRFRFASSSGALYRFVKPELVIEAVMTDLQFENASGQPVRRMVLEYAGGVWIPTRAMAGVSLIHPVFSRVRDDKTVNQVDVRAEQILERVLVTDLEAHAEAVQRPTSEVVRREVYVKTTKDRLAVRKLVVFKTNKEEADEAWPAYVVHWTDFSPGRKEPLQRTVRLAPTAEVADHIADELVEKGVKRGWTPAGEA